VTIENNHDHYQDLPDCSRYNYWNACRSHTNFEVQGLIEQLLRLVEGVVSVVRSFNMIKRRNQVDQPELLSISKRGQRDGRR
jgi:hypothetical protein